MSEVIRFYSTADEYGCFSNFARCPFALDGARWPTSEHYFQAQKFDAAADREEVRLAKSPMLAARLGRSRKKKLRADWESVKVEVMRRALRAKFAQNGDARAALLGTGDATLVEHTDKDSFWGDGGDGSGRNMLGRLLVEVRAEIRGQAE